ncbi:MAG: prolyl oligopeptidase family serine peptidase [Clostridia bacterium]|nr:prolyl oligopeptidase family serine peptidase [Clostridia bacterium]
MRKSIYSPDEFMSGLYGRMQAKPFADIKTAEDALKVGEEIREKAKTLFAADRLLGGNYKLEKAGRALEYPEYSLQKYSFELCEGLKSAVFILTPKNIKKSAPGVVALCGHGYGVRQILGISKSGKKKRIGYFDNYQKNFAVELAKRGCIVAAPELFGFGEARLKKDLNKPFYISSCDELSHHLLPYGLTTASVRIAQAIACGEILLKETATDPENLGVMGISGGGLTALYASVINEKFKKTVISGYVNTFESSILSMWHCPDNYIPGILEIGEIYDFAASLAPRKLLIESGTKDKLFPIEASRKAHREIKKVYSLADAADKLQIDVFEGKHSVSGRKSFDFLAK